MKMDSPEMLRELLEAGDHTFRSCSWHTAEGFSCVDDAERAYLRVRLNRKDGAIRLGHIAVADVAQIADLLVVPTPQQTGVAA